MFTVIYHPEAEEELVSAARFYNERVPGLGADLLKEVDDAIVAILRYPTRWRVVEKDFRRHAVERFPYAIIYRVERNSIRIVAVAHHRRHPSYWKHRKDW